MSKGSFFEERPEAAITVSPPYRLFRYERETRDLLKGASASIAFLAFLLAVLASLRELPGLVSEIVRLAPGIVSLIAAFVFYSLTLRITRVRREIALLNQLFQDTLVMKMLERGYDVVRSRSHPREFWFETEPEVDIIARRGQDLFFVDIRPGWPERPPVVISQIKRYSAQPGVTKAFVVFLGSPGREAMEQFERSGFEVVVTEGPQDAASVINQLDSYTKHG